MTPPRWELSRAAGFCAVREKKNRTLQKRPVLLFAIGYWFTRSGLRGCIECGSKRIVLFGGVGLLAGLPVHSLVVAGTIHCVDLAVLVDVSQAPGDIVDGGEDQVLVQEVSLGLGKCSVACIAYLIIQGTFLVLIQIFVT